MRVERDKVEHIVTTAASFNWTWTDDDLLALCEALGWPGVAGRTGGTTTLRNDLAVAKSQAYWRAWEKGGVRDLIMVVTDKIDPSDAPAVDQMRDDFTHLAERLTDVLGTPRSLERGREPKIRWDRPNLVIRLFVASGYINLYLDNPAYQQWLDTPEEFRTYD